MTMTGKTALEAHKLLTAIGTAAKGRAGELAPPEKFLAALHDAGYDVVKLADEPAAARDLAAE